MCLDDQHDQPAEAGWIFLHVLRPAIQMDHAIEIPAFEAKGRKRWLKPTNVKGGRGRSDVSKTRASWNHRNDRSRESGRNRSFALCSRALDDLINGPKYSDILLLGNCHPTTCPNPVWGEVKKMSRHV